MNIKKFFLIVVAAIGFSGLTVLPSKAQIVDIINLLGKGVELLADNATPKIVNDPTNKIEIVNSLMELKESNREFGKYYKDIQAVYDTAKKIRQVTSTVQKAKDCSDLLQKIANMGTTYGDALYSGEFSYDELNVLVSYYQVVRARAAKEVKYLQELINTKGSLSYKDRLDILDQVYNNLSALYSSSLGMTASFNTVSSSRAQSRAQIESYCGFYGPREK